MCQCGRDTSIPNAAIACAPTDRRVIRRTGRRPRTVTPDRDYGEARVENDLHDLGVRTVVIPRKGRPGKARQVDEHRRAFRGTVSGAPAAKPGSAPSNEATDGAAHAWMISKAPRSGPDTGSWPQPRQDGSHRSMIDH
jgi:IS5 family transposase